MFSVFIYDLSRTISKVGAQSPHISEELCASAGYSTSCGYCRPGPISSIIASPLIGRAGLIACIMGFPSNGKAGHLASTMASPNGRAGGPLIFPPMVELVPWPPSWPYLPMVELIPIPPTWSSPVLLSHATHTVY